MLFVKAVAMGFCIAAPVGAIGMLCIQRSMSRGFCAGLATGIGAACADAFYGLLGVLGVAGIVTALPMLTVVLKAAGGAFLVWMAWTIARESPRAPAAVQENLRTTVTRDFLTTFALTLSNPLTIFSFIAAFAALGPLPAMPGEQGAPGWLSVAPMVTMVTGVFAGSAVWWLFLSSVTSALRTRLPLALTRGISIFSAVAIAAFGVVQMVTGLARLA
ncbi:threonine/homoserine/homoserine lactone efflux protein [Paraburkholderia silvatlantica]|uniref:Threonine/homoserine/homoserine lactone efflux protein n=1 Tax=Paraburkholderia silvatlantica TaxID=321895 RepID=A0A2V4U259_9BURK|nr:LysE family transporter [Paraburkholderia silvatlantica]PYE14432.1 threonine/homoserine/homoserine lactone efflux protein [Paraburkholderia silvatlantica]